MIGVDYLEIPGVRDRIDEFYQADLEQRTPGARSAAATTSSSPATSSSTCAARRGAATRCAGCCARAASCCCRCRTSATGTRASGSPFGLFGYDRRGILDDTHLRFFTRRTLRRMVRGYGFDILEERATGLPLGTISEADGLRLRTDAQDSTAASSGCGRRCSATSSSCDWFRTREEAVVVEGL